MQSPVFCRSRGQPWYRQIVYARPFSEGGVTLRTIHVSYPELGVYRGLPESVPELSSTDLRKALVIPRPEPVKIQSTICHHSGA